jgi:prophage antirepressor-like protein
MNIFTIKNKFFEIPAFIDERKKVWLSAKAVLDVLGTDNSQMRRVDAENKQANVFPYAGNNQKGTAISYAGFVELVGPSRMPKAIEFKRWMGRVMDCITLYGVYIPGMEELTHEQCLEVAAKAQTAKDEVARLVEENRRLKEENEKLSAGNDKLSAWLIAEEDYREQQQDENRALKEQAAETERKLNDPAFLAQRLTEVEERRASEDAACQRAYEDKRRVYLNEQACAEPAPDQLGYDIRSGLVMRPAEFVAIDHDSTRHDD